MRRQHSPAAQLGIALQLCALRWLGFVPEDLTCRAAGGDRRARPRRSTYRRGRSSTTRSGRQTRREHRPLVREHAGFAPSASGELDALRAWLIEQALEHERPSLLLVRAVRRAATPCGSSGRPSTG